MSPPFSQNTIYTFFPFYRNVLIISNWRNYYFFWRPRQTLYWSGEKRPFFVIFNFYSNNLFFTLTNRFYLKQLFFFVFQSFVQPLFPNFFLHRKKTIPVVLIFRTMFYQIFFAQNICALIILFPPNYIVEESPLRIFFNLSRLHYKDALCGALSNDFR